METSITRIKCPYCGTVITVKSSSGLKGKSVRCPVCKETSKYESFKVVLDTKEEEHTQLGTNQNYTLGELLMAGIGAPFRLTMGRNVIGRKASASTADVQIPTGDSKRLSREHLVIDIKKVPGKGLVHFVSLFKEKTNATFINDTRLEYGDCVVLQSGDVLKLPDATVRFVIPDEDETEL